MIPLRLLGAGAALAACLPGAAPGQSGFVYEGPPELDAAALLPPSLMQSVHHRVRNEVEARGTTLAFVVESPLGTFQAASLALLEERIHELQTLGQAVSQLERDDRPFGAELRGQLQVTGESFEAILGSPLSTASQLAGQLGSNIRQTIVEVNRGAGPSVEAAEPEPVAAPDAQRRAVAAGLGLDPYSSNPKVQRFLASMASRRAGGAIGSSVATVSVARGDSVQVAGGLVDRRVRSDLKNLEPDELEYRNDARLAAMGVTREVRGRFLRHPVLTPRHQTTIIGHLEFIGPIPGRAALIEAASGAGSEAQALGFERVARMLAVYHERVAALRAFTERTPVTAATDARGHLVLALAADLLYWSPEADRALSTAERTRAGGARELLLVGVLSEQARAALGARGYGLHERFLAGP